MNMASVTTYQSAYDAYKLARACERDVQPDEAYRMYKHALLMFEATLMFESSPLLRLLARLTAQLEISPRLYELAADYLIPHSDYTTILARVTTTS